MMEPRIHVTFDADTMINKAWVIAVPKGSPAITPASTNFDAMSVATSIAQITKVFTVCYPRPSILIAGPLLSSALIFGPQVGVPHGMGFSFDPANTTNVDNATNVTVFDAGTSTVFTDIASAIVVPATTTAVVTGAPVIQTLYNQLTLDGSSSTTDVGPLTYQWSATGTGVAILDPANVMTRVQIGGLAGDYPVTLTVTSAAGQSASTHVTVRYVGK